jgi:hypothetical protein
VFSNLLPFHPTSVPIFSEHPLIQIVSQVRGLWWPLVTKLSFLRWVFVRPTPTPQTWRPHLVGCPRLLFQYICSHLPYLEAVLSLRNLKTRHAMVARDPRNNKIRTTYSTYSSTDISFLFLTSGEICISWNVHWEYVWYFCIQIVVSGRNFSPTFTERLWRQWDERHGWVDITAPYSRGLGCKSRPRNRPSSLRFSVVLLGSSRPG